MFWIWWDQKQHLIWTPFDFHGLGIKKSQVWNNIFGQIHGLISVHRSNMLELYTKWMCDLTTYSNIEVAGQSWIRK